MTNITVIGIDIAKSVFHLVGLNHTGTVVFRSKLRRDNLLGKLQEVNPGGVVAMEACSSSHYWGRELVSKNFEVKLIPPQHVKQFRINQKNDYNDALAICEASLRATIHLVPIKDVARQDLQHLLRLRERVLRDRTSLSNQLHGVLLESGFSAPKGINKLKEFSKELLREGKLTELIHDLLSSELETLAQLELRIKRLDSELKSYSRKHEVISRMCSVPGIGPIGAASLFAATTDPKRFKNGRQYAAWLGLVPVQHSTGGRTRLGSLSKKGSFPLRALIIHGAPSLLRCAPGKEDKLNLWVLELDGRKSRNVAVVALANKLARIVWRVMVSPNGYYQKNHELLNPACPDNPKH